MLGKRTVGKYMMLTGIVILIISLVCFYFFLKKTIEPNMEEVGAVKSRALINDIVNKTINKNFTEFDDAADLLIIKTDKDGNIKLVQSDTKKINSLISELMIQLQRKYVNMEPEETKIPIGYLLGSKVLSQTGPCVRLKIIPTSVSQTSFKTELEEEGINQTKYKIYMVLKSEIRVLAPFIDKELSVTNTVLIAETVILGQVPDNYVVVPKESILDAVE